MPRLAFLVDPGIVSGQRIEDLLREIHHQEASGDEHGVAPVEPGGTPAEDDS